MVGSFWYPYYFVIIPTPEDVNLNCESADGYGHTYQFGGRRSGGGGLEGNDKGDDRKAEERGLGKHSKARETR